MLHGLSVYTKLLFKSDGSVKARLYRKPVIWGPGLPNKRESSWPAHVGGELGSTHWQRRYLQGQKR